MNTTEKGDYKNLISERDRAHNRQHNEDEGKRDRYSRYKSSAMTARLEAERLGKHDEINEKSEKKMARFRHGIQMKHEVA
jgi:hypothetical protein